MNGMVRQRGSEALSLPFYHPNIRSMEQVRAIMGNFVQDGYFLLRDSTSDPGVKTVSVMHLNGIKHFKVYSTGSSFYICNDTHLASLQELVNFYHDHDVPNVEGVHHVRLLRPIVCHRNTPPVTRSTSVIAAPSTPRKLTAAFGRLSLDSGVPAAAGNGSVLRGSNHSMNGSRSSIEERPPMPLPPRPRDANPYDEPIDTEHDRSRDLIYQIDKIERQALMCDCGLSFEDSELPMEWSMHISHEPETEGRIFFMGPNELTVWKLPFEVTLLLSTEQQDRIRFLMRQYQFPSRNNSSGSSSCSQPGGGHGRGGGVEAGRRDSAVSPRQGEAPLRQGEPAFKSEMPSLRQATEHECHSGEGTEVFST